MKAVRRHKQAPRRFLQPSHGLRCRAEIYGAFRFFRADRDAARAHDLLAREHAWRCRITRTISLPRAKIWA
jgi:hypothetical protein